MVWPPIPKEVQGIHGKIKVVRPNVVSKSEPSCVGQWDNHLRKIKVKATLSREAAWPILGHEMGHAMLDDLGVNDLRDELEERICEGIASIVVSACTAFRGE